MIDLLNRLYRTKLLLTCVALVGGGVFLIALDRQVSAGFGWSRLDVVPLGELGGILVGGGLLSLWIDHLLSREKAAGDELRLRRLLQDQAPAMRDAVLDAFAANHEDLARIATPELLDNLITNSLALRLGDEQFAAEVYGDIRDQAVGATERWYGAQASVRLDPLPSADHGKASAKVTPLFSVEVRWEYTVTPSHAERRFVCVSDKDEYLELAHQRGATSAWYISPTAGVDASEQSAFELVQFSVDGLDRPIRRTTRKGSQVYTASVGRDAVSAGQPVKISYTYRTVTAQSGHLLYLDVEQPTKDLSVHLDYTDTTIESVAVLDLVPSTRPTRLERSPVSLSSRSVRIELSGWIFPRCGVGFVWR